MSTAIQTIESECLVMHEDMTNDEVLTVYDRIQFYTGECAKIKAQVEAAMLAWIRAHGDLDNGKGVRYYAGQNKTTKCTDLPGTVSALMEATGGDFTQFCSVLSSGAIKHGAAKKILAETVYDTLFVTETKEVLEEGKPVKKLMKFDERFIRK